MRVNVLGPPFRSSTRNSVGSCTPSALSKANSSAALQRSSRNRVHTVAMWSAYGVSSFVPVIAAYRAAGGISSTQRQTCSVATSASSMVALRQEQSQW